MLNRAMTPASIRVRRSRRKLAQPTMNLKEIAKRAEVSTATVSRAINRIPTVDPQLAKRVWKIVDELGYYPDKQARALVSGQSRIFGLIVSDLTNPFFPEVVQAFDERASRHNYETLLSSAAHERKEMEAAVRRMIERRVDGIAIMTIGIDEAPIESFRFHNLPLVVVDTRLQMPGVTNIRIDYQHGIRQAVQHLAALRHSRIAFVAGPPDFNCAVARRRAFEKSMQEIELPIPPEFIVVGDHTIEGGMQALRTLAALPLRPTAVLCSNDMSAIGALRQAADSGITVPNELSVVGVDDIRLAQFTTPPLTTVQISQVELAALAFGALIEGMKKDKGISSTHEYALISRLVLRGTTVLGRTEQLNPLSW
jgi:LacI family transcriptional regulator